MKTYWSIYYLELAPKVLIEHLVGTWNLAWELGQWLASCPLSSTDFEERVCQKPVAWDLALRPFGLLPQLESASQPRSEEETYEQTSVLNFASKRYWTYCRLPGQVNRHLHRCFGYVEERDLEPFRQESPPSSFPWTRV